MTALKERKKSKANAKQQFSMTSMNNLALLLDDVLDKMQQQMADAMGKGQGKPQDGNTPGLSELQKQLNQQISELKKSGKKGRELSEELARLVAAQERLRQSLREMGEKMSGGNKGGGTNLDELLRKMEETEKDLVNKQLSSETIERQKDILTRLLQAEDALRERELDEKREAEQAKTQQNGVPESSLKKVIEAISVKNKFQMKLKYFVVLIFLLASSIPFSSFSNLFDMKAIWR